MAEVLTLFYFEMRRKLPCDASNPPSSLELRISATRAVAK